MSVHLVRALLVVGWLLPPAGHVVGEALASAAQEAAEAEKLFREGVDAYLGLTKDLDEARALKLFRQAAAKGHPLARGWAGRMTLLGRGTDRDEAEGLKLIKQALPEVRKRAEGEDADAQFLLAA